MAFFCVHGSLFWGLIASIAYTKTRTEPHLGPLCVSRLLYLFGNVWDVAETKEVNAHQALVVGRVSQSVKFVDRKPPSKLHVSVKLNH